MDGRAPGKSGPAVQEARRGLTYFTMVRQFFTPGETVYSTTSMIFLIRWTPRPPSGGG